MTQMSMDNVNPSGYVYMPYPNVALNPLYPQNVGNVGPYQHNTGQVVQGQTRVDKTQPNQSFGGAVRPPSFTPCGRGSFSRGVGMGCRTQRESFVPHNTCARCGEKGHLRMNALMKGIVLPNSHNLRGQTHRNRK